ncbi:MAG TPA: carbohydrate kinase [Candidatus Solibacter sp.]|nr:carbohydrate kinase [Candidatus Solibacter sp.]
MKIISIGEVLWDVIGDEEHPGGAPFNFAAHARRLGHEVFFVSAVGKDLRGEKILDSMAETGLSTCYVRSVKNQPTGVVTVTVDSSGQPDYVIHRPAAYDFPRLTQPEVEELLSPLPIWIYYGTLQQTSSAAHDLTMSLLRSGRDARRFYDVNLRRGCYTPELVRELMAEATVIKLNQQEVGEIANMFGDSYPAVSTLEDFCRRYTAQFEWEAICVTRGDQGCAVLMGGRYVESPAYPVRVIDAVGAGDAFSAAFVHGFSANWEPAEIADFANRVGAVVASRPGAIPNWTTEEALQLKQKE